MNEDLNSHPVSILGRLSTYISAVRRHFLRLWPFAASTAAAVLLIWLYTLYAPAPTPLTLKDIDDTVIQAIASVTPAPSYSSRVYQIILPSLAFIQTRGNNAEDEEGVGIGSGVVVNADGDILTAYHVVAKATEIEIIFADGTHTTAQILTAEPENDVAVLRPAQLPELFAPAILGSAGAMRVGDEAFAVGNPLGLAGSMSAGVISAFDRSIPIDESGQRLEGLIQFDTAVNPGSSGGPLLNRNGQVIGIVTALANPSDQNFFVGIGFAIPISTAGGAAGAPGY